MTATRKITNYWKSGPDDLVTSISPISEAPIYPKPIDDIEIDPEG